MRAAALIASAVLTSTLMAACDRPAAPEPDVAATAAAAASAAVPAPTAQVPAGLEAALRRLNADDGDLTYAFAPVDLDGDGTDEVLAYVMGPMVCGSGGCNLYVLARDGGDWRVVTRTSVTQTPIGVLPASTNGWRDLAVSIGGGGAQAGWVRLTFGGRTYPTNPTAAPATPLDGQPDVTTLIASEPDARPLPN